MNNKKLTLNAGDSQKPQSVTAKSIDTALDVPDSTSKKLVIRPCCPRKKRCTMRGTR